MKLVLTVCALAGASLIGVLAWLWTSPGAGAQSTGAAAPPPAVQGRSFLAAPAAGTDAEAAAAAEPGSDALARGDAPGADEPPSAGSAAGAGSAPAPAGAPKAAHGADAGEKPKTTTEGYPLLTWEDIAYYDYELPEPVEDEDAEPTNEQIPAEMLAWNGKKIGIEGHMVPLEVEEGRVHSFVHSRYFAGCCFGGVPMMNEWLEVEVADEKGADYLPFSPILVTGTFEVGEVVDEYGYVSSIYRLRAERVEELE